MSPVAATLKADLLHPKALDWEPSQSCLEDSMMTAEEERELLELMSDEE